MCNEELEGSEVDQYALAQVQMICDNRASEGSVIRVMPDVHPGKVGPIGLTMTIGERILPSLVGIDIGCGMLAVKVGKIRSDFQKLDTVIRDNVPVGFKIREKAHRQALEFDFERLRCCKHIRSDKALLSIGTLGGGNAEWNSSAPHGSGRIASRDKTVNSHTVSEFKASMKGIYSSCISKDTLDEAPFAYRSTDYIKEAVKDTVEISKLLKPVYNYKGGNA